MIRSSFWAGIRAEFPLLVGVFPFGLIYGVLAIEAGLSIAEAQSMSWMVFAGSSQLLATQLVHGAVPGMVIVLTIVIVNLRHMLYSASLAPYLRKLSSGWKLLLAYLLTDEAYAVTIKHYEETEDNTHSHWFFLGAALALWSTWQISTGLGIAVGEILPADWPLDFALPLTFIAIVVPMLKSWPSLAAAVSAGAVAVVAVDLPYNTGLLAAAIVGIMVGMLLEKDA
jgi:4-azaleucine resistance transporter AzlC